MARAERVRDLLKKSNIDDLNPDYVFATALPQTIQDNPPDEPIVFIRDIGNNPTQHGSNHTHARREQVQIQYFFPTNFGGDTDDLDEAVLFYLEKNRWFCTFDSGEDRDPDTRALYITTFFSHLKEKDD